MVFIKFLRVIYSQILLILKDSNTKDKSRYQYLKFLRQNLWNLCLRRKQQGQVVPFHIKLPEAVQQILKELQKLGITALVVGGPIRDTLLDITPKDYDIEVYGLSPEELAKILEKFGPVSIVGIRFGVIKLQYKGLELDFAVARKDNKQGVGKQGFNSTFDLQITIIEACSRRDLRINAMVYDSQFEILIDCYKGLNDLKNGILKATSSGFTEDPTRAYRIVTFAARFGFKIDPSTAILCQGMLKDEHSTIAPEMIYEEWKKFLLKGKDFLAGFTALQESGLEHFYSEIANLKGCVQDPKHHPEGDVWTHTIMVLEAMSSICDREKIIGDDKLTLMFAALCHDFGKPATTKLVDGRIRALGHCQAGIEPTEIFLKAINCPKGIIQKVLKLVEAHLDHASYNGVNPTRGALARLKDKIFPASIWQLVFLVEADQSGRHPLPPSSPISHYVELEKKFGLDKPKFVPLIMGKDLIELGYKPGPKLGELLKLIEEAELSGDFNTYEEGIKWLKDEHNKGTFKQFSIVNK